MNSCCLNMENFAQIRPTKLKTNKFIVHELPKRIRCLKVYPQKSFSPLPAESSPVSRWTINIVNGDACGDSPVDMVSSEEGALYKVELKSNQRVTDSNHFQDVRLLEFTCSDKQLDYKPGDLAVILPENSFENVSTFFSLFCDVKETNIRPDTNVEVIERYAGVQVPKALRQRVCSLKLLVHSYWDLNFVPGRRPLEILAEVTNSDLEREKLLELIRPENTQDLYDYINRPKRSILELLMDFPGAIAGLQLSHLFEMFRPIRPRSFSIASSPLEKELKLLVAVVNYKTKLKAPRVGLCSNWLASLPVTKRLSMIIRRGSFKFPENTEVPVVMVGPGTGVAPFRSFIMTSHLQGLRAPMVLFFGCRSEKKDFYFKSDWETVPHLELFTAFSRDQTCKIYVQDVMMKCPELLKKYIVTLNGYFFYAGSSKLVPESVRNSLIRCMNVSDEEAEAFLENMENTKKYQTEAWS